MIYLDYVIDIIVLVINLNYIGWIENFEYKGKNNR